jgi:hypothetical protein
MTRTRRILTVIAVLAIVLAACSSGGDDETTTSSIVGEGDGSSTTTSLEDGAPETTIPDEEILLAYEEMCRTLELFYNADVGAHKAADSMLATDLVGATSVQKAAYGDVLIGAPQTLCPFHVEYSGEIAYWLGF